MTLLFDVAAHVTGFSLDFVTIRCVPPRTVNG
jgi:hypothetical protein